MEVTTITTIALGAIATISTALFGWLRFRDELKFKSSETKLQNVSAELIIVKKEREECRKDVEALKVEILDQQEKLRKTETNNLRMALHLSELAQMVSRAQMKGLTAVIQVGADGKIQQWPPAATALFQWRDDEMLGKDISYLVPPNMRRRHHDAFFQMVKEHREPRQEPIDAVALDRNGREFQIRIALAGWEVDGVWTYSAKISTI